MAPTLPYQIAVLCYLFDEEGRLLLLHRSKPPNQDLFSPIGGKLDQRIGESPTDCAIREIQEEAGLNVSAAELHLTGIVTESSYENTSHWLMFLYEVNIPVRVQRTSFEEGRLEWHAPQNVQDLAIPQTDRHVIWPLFWRYRGRFFMAHIQCQQKAFTWSIQQPAADAAVFQPP